MAFHVHVHGRLSVSKISVLLDLSYRSNVTPEMVSANYFMDIDKLDSVVYMERQKTQNSSGMLKENKGR